MTDQVLKPNPEKEFAALGVSFLLVAPEIKTVLDYVDKAGNEEQRAAAKTVLKALFTPPEVQVLPPNDEAIELAKQYEGLIEQG